MVVKRFVMLLFPVIAVSESLSHRVPMLRETPAKLWFSVADGPTKNFTLPCSTTKRLPYIEYFWRKDGKILNLTLMPDIITNKFDGNVTFLTPTVKIIGWYQCFAKSALGVASSGIIIVKEMFLQRPTVTFTKDGIVTAPVKLDCPVIANHVLEYKWKSKCGDCEIYEDLVEPVVIPDGSLWVNDLRSNVTYACFVSSPAFDGPELIVEHQLEVVKRGTSDGLKELYSSEAVRANLRGDAKLFCIFNGSQKMRTHWSKDGVRLKNSPRISILGEHGWQLLIRRVRSEDQEIFSCLVDNGDGRKRIRSVDLNIYGAPTFEDVPEKLITVPLASAIFLTFAISAGPEPEIIWTLNSEALRNAKQVELTTFFEIGSALKTNLHMKNVTRQEAGYYGCLVFNRYGVAYSETFLRVA